MQKIPNNPQARADLLFKELDDGGVIYEPQTEKCHSLNATSAYIWSLCDGHHTFDEIVANIKRDFDDFKIEPEAAVREIIEKFDSTGLLEK